MNMNMSVQRTVGVAAWGMAASALVVALGASQSAQEAEGCISGIVESRQGREAGVWVIAETTDLATPLIKIVVTDRTSGEMPFPSGPVPGNSLLSGTSRRPYQ